MTDLYVSLSIRQISAETGFARDTVRKRLAEANVKSCEKRGGHPVYRLRDVLPVLYFGHDDEFDPDKLKPFEQKAYYQAAREKLHLQLERGDVVPSIEVERKFGAMIKKLVHVLETLPDVLERDCGASPLLLAKIERVLDELRESLYAMVVAEEDAVCADEDSA